MGTADAELLVKGLTPEELVIGPDTEESGPGEIEIDEGHGENENVHLPQFCRDVIQVGRQKNSKSGVLLGRGIQRQKGNGGHLHAFVADTGVQQKLACIKPMYLGKRSKWLEKLRKWPGNEQFFMPPNFGVHG